jgi:hypothetical protein
MATRRDQAGPAAALFLALIRPAKPASISALIMKMLRVDEQAGQVRRIDKTCCFSIMA